MINTKVTTKWKASDIQALLNYNSTQWKKFNVRVTILFLSFFY